MGINFQPLRETYNELLSDYEFSKKLDLKIYSEDFVKRSVVRSYFALVEGSLFQLKQVAVQGNSYYQVLDQFELGFLQERSVFVAENGVVKTKSSQISLVPNLLFTANSLIKVFNLNYTLIKGTGYEAFKDAIKIRDKITHPKSKSDITLSTQEILKIGDANIWYRDIFTDLINLIDNSGKVT